MPSSYAQQAWDGRQTLSPEFEKYNKDTPNYNASPTTETTAPEQHAGFLGPAPEVYVSPRDNHHVLRFWGWEVVAMAFGAGILVAIAVILGNHHGRPVPDWPLSINLTTLVALLSVILRSCLIMVLSEIISQAKWTWFSRPRPLAHLQNFDEASRGILGSIRLIFTAWSSPFAGVAAIVTVASLVVGPFAQQAVKSVACSQVVPTLSSSLPIAYQGPMYDSLFRVAAGIWDLYPPIKGAMAMGLVQPDSRDSAITATCQTGNCTFPEHDGITHSTIGMCRSCIDTTPYVKHLNVSNEARGNVTLGLPSGLTIWASHESIYLAVGMSDLEIYRDAITDEIREAGKAIIANVTILTFTNATCKAVGDVITCPHNLTAKGLDYVAASCALYPCLKNFRGIVSAGQLKEELVSSQPALPGRPGGAGRYINVPFSGVKTPCWINDTRYDLGVNFTSGNLTTGQPLITVTNTENASTFDAPRECVYSVPGIYLQTIQGFLGRELLSGRCRYNSRQGLGIVCDDNRWWLASLHQNRNATFASLDSAMNGFATAMTNYFRRAENTLVQGTVLETTVCAVFEWRWLLLPIALVLTTIMLLVAMVVRNMLDTTIPVWKSNPLPYLFYGFRDTAAANTGRSTEDNSQLRRRAKMVRTTFRGGHDAGFEDVTGGRFNGSSIRSLEVDSLYEGR